MRYTPRNRQQWRRWLEKHHGQATEVWLVFRKKTAGNPNLSYNDAVEEALCFGWIDGIKRRIDDEHYAHRFSPRKPDSQWSRSNKERVKRLLDAGLMTPAGTRTIEQAKKRGNWDRPVDGSRRFTMPPELAARLGRSARAAAFFDSLAPSCRRQYIDWIASAKRPETRKRRLDEAMELLQKGRRLGMR